MQLDAAFPWETRLVVQGPCWRTMDQTPQTLEHAAALAALQLCAPRAQADLHSDCAGVVGAHANIKEALRAKKAHAGMKTKQ